MNSDLRPTPVENVQFLELCNWVPEKNSAFFLPNFGPHCDLTTYVIIRTTQDPLVHHGRHFGRAIHAFCNVQTLILNGLQTMYDDAPDDESLTAA